MCVCVCVCVYHISFIHLSIDRYLDYFHVLAIVNEYWSARTFLKYNLFWMCTQDCGIIW